MNKFIAILVFAAGIATHCHAQSFLNELTKAKQGEGTVTVKQSADIDNLVNNAKLKASSNQAAQQTTAKPERQNEKTVVANTQRKEEHTATSHNKQAEASEHRQAATEHRNTVAEHKTATAEHKTATPAERNTTKSNDADITPMAPVVDTSKKMMRNSYKVTGYRIQAFSGGNSRADREKANQIGDAIKMRYPDQPVYVHFYSPRWICRVGNYRSYSEAAQMLRAIKAMGYKQACIVKGKINIAY